ncbi:MAG: DUF1631 domain-containing protein [Arenimonas sp.]
MSGLSIEPHNTAPTLASKNLPRRTRNLLEGILEFASDEFERGVISSLNEFEQQLFKHAEQARSAAVQTRWLEAQRLIKRTRPDLVPRFLIALEAELSLLRDPYQPKHLFMSRTGTSSLEMSLVNELEMDEATIMTEISNRAEMRNSLPLYLLGQRFGVLAGKPAFDSETLPIGPQAVCRMIREASDCLGLNEEHRLMFFKVFEKQVMHLYGNLIESINNYLAKNNVLPNLQYVPIRARPKSQSETVERISEGIQQASKKTTSQSFGLSLDDLPHRNTERSSLRSRESLQSSPLEQDAITALAGNVIGGFVAKGTADKNDSQNAAPTNTRRPGELATDTDLANFNMMRQLLASRKQLLGKLNPEKIHTHGSTTPPVDIGILQKTLQMLQSKPTSPIVSGGKKTARSIQHIKQDLMSHLRMDTGNQEAPVLEPEDNDTIDLIGMLFESINKDVKENSPAAHLLAKLQVPLLRVALQDKSFFTKENHPARQMLGTIAESGAYWMSDDDADPALMSKMNAVVDRTVREFDGDMSLFQQLLLDINSHLQILSRKAEVAEKRHIEAARGKEKLALARDQASVAVDGLLKDQTLPRFTHTLLSQAWTDVMALTALRSGEDSESWKQHLQVAERLIQVAKAPPGQSPISAEEAQQLKAEIESSLTQVGYQDDEAAAITERLIDPQSGKEGDSASRTELTMRLKSRARFGEDVSATQAKKVKLTAEEQARYEQLKLVAFGTWFEFTTNQQGDRVRRRLAWFSTMTGHSLFVNQRGQKVGEYHLEALARMMAKDELHIVEEQGGGLIDRAWQSVMNALRSFAGQPGTEAPAK